MSASKRPWRRQGRFGPKTCHTEAPQWPFRCLDGHKLTRNTRCRNCCRNLVVLTILCTFFIIGCFYFLCPEGEDITTYLQTYQHMYLCSTYVHSMYLHWRTTKCEVKDEKDVKFQLECPFWNRAFIGGARNQHCNYCSVDESLSLSLSYHVGM